jgi:hypothetical protein
MVRSGVKNMKTMGFLTKIELKKQLQQLGVQVEGNYIRKSYIKRLADQIRAEEGKFESRTGQYAVYIMPEEEGKQAGKTVPIGYALKRSKRTDKKIKLTLTDYQDSILNLTYALKSAGLIDHSSTEKDIDYI